MKLHLQLCLWALLLAPVLTLAQEPVITLSGQVADAATRQPVAFASIQLKNAGTGTASNTSGDFVLKIPGKLAADTLLISCIGYRAIARAIPPGGMQDMQLMLEPAIIALPEISVNARSGLAILREAIARIPDNYDTADARLTAFYREHIRLDGDTINFNESVLDIYKTFRDDKEHHDQIRILKGRKKKVDQSADPQFYGWISNIMNTAYSSLHEDLQKYSGHKRSLLNERNLKYYHVEYRETTREGDRNLLVLYVTPRENSRKGLVNARFFIDEASRAIVKFELEAAPRGIEWVNKHGKGGFKYTIMSRIVGADFDFTGLRVTIHYKYFRGKWYLGTVRRHWDVLVNSRKRNIHNMPWTGDFSLLVTDVSKDSVQRFSAGVSDKNASMNYLTGGDYDAAFWEHYNILQPDLPDSLQQPTPAGPPAKARDTAAVRVSNRQNGFTRADTLRGMLTPLRTCYDVTFYHLDVDINMDQRSIKGSNKLRFKVAAPFGKMQIDLFANMRIDSILYRDQPLAYTRESDAVFVHFPEALPAGSEQEITVYYQGRPQTPDSAIPMHGGVFWDQDNAGNPWVQVACQGSGASLWWPNKDHLSDEPDSMRIWITVPNGFTEVSNGRLQRTTPVGSHKTRYEWLVSYPINNYNATFNIGKYAHYRDLYTGLDTLTLDYYVMPYNLDRARALFRQVKPMLACYEQHFGPYPFPRDGFTLVESLHPMEHQSGVCIGRITPQNSGDTHPLLWHESAHEWWGNAISCEDLADMWIHEAFATYAESLVIACSYGKETAQEFLNDQQAGVRHREPVIGVYDVNHIFYDIGDMYSKGSLMLSTFRNVLDNDTLWFRLLKDIQQHFRYRTLSSDELVQYICRRTRRDYTYFFDQYLQHTALPELELSLQEQENNLAVKYRWKADVPDFRMPVKVTTAVDQFRFIYPETNWQSMVLKNMTAEDFEVDDTHFYIAVSGLE
ncbi:M1 family aminopeptidase [Chitinophaga japonensis]|uniref:Aminopeptidase N n=1 Tax=Chitinophaga japonensis TaxID=104662 RepID=A0A562T091_CHIJA|nr:M1 family aminopeptidase [Chitinophaga japonensis]TWI86955.1 aminopeptidase N [Chitinophaga japonensis]